MNTDHFTAGVDFTEINGFTLCNFVLFKNNEVVFFRNKADEILLCLDLCQALGVKILKEEQMDESMHREATPEAIKHFFKTNTEIKDNPVKSKLQLRLEQMAKERGYKMPEAPSTEEINSWDQKTTEYRALAEQKGYVHGTWIKTPDVNVPLMVGHNPVWSPNQKALVIGCTDKDNQYYTAVPIYKPESNWWAPIVTQSDSSPSASDSPQPGAQ